jgi:hypothetical protein
MAELHSPERGDEANGHGSAGASQATTAKVNGAILQL